MVSRWKKLFHFQIHRVLFFILMFHLQFDECMPINQEGSALLEFRALVETDPYGVFANWNPSDNNPCMWFGVHCMDGEVQMLDLRELSLGGMLAPELGKLSNLRALVLYKNNFSGEIPKEIAELSMLELMDLRGNNLSGTIPTEMGHMLSLRHLFLCNNKFQGRIPTESEKLRMPFELQYDQNLSLDAATGTGCINRKVGYCIWQSSLKRLNQTNSFMLLLKGGLLQFLDILPLLKFEKDSLHNYEDKCFDNLAGSTGSHVLNPARRMLLQESHNLHAAPIIGVPPNELATIPSFGSGSFPAIPDNGKKQSSAPASSPFENHANSPPSIPTPQKSSPTPASSIEMPSTIYMGTDNYIFVLPAGAFLTIAVAVLFICHSRTRRTIVPWETEQSGQSLDAFVTGVPKLTREELETACEDFSNIISTLPACTVYKGTLSSGVEVAVASTSITSLTEWSKSSEMLFREKVDAFSRLNHKNFVNILGYCEEDEPFYRMMVFDYAPNGTLFEHLHVKGVEHLDWPARVRIIMGVAYCLQCIHHELKPPIPHPNLTSSSILLLDDYAAKIFEFSFWEKLVVKGNLSGGDDTSLSESPLMDSESDVYNFGILLLEIISGKLPYSDEGSLVDWAVQHLHDKRGCSYIIDSSLQSFNDNQLDRICEVIMACIHQDPNQRPTMQEVTSELKEVIPISPEAAGPRPSPLWWAELEILSVEAG